MPQSTNLIILVFITLSSMFAAQVGARSEDLTQREDVNAFIERVSVTNKLDAVQLRSALAAARVQQSILEAIARPAEKTLEWAQYRKIFLQPERIKGGVAFGKQYESDLRRAEQQFGVPASIIIAIIGVETRYGKHMGNYRVIDALATLAFDYPPRSKFFTKELENFLLLSFSNKQDPLAARGSYAGAMGYGQFMPSSYRAYAIDFDGDGLADIWNNPVDAIGSVANYFARHGWKESATVIVPARRNGKSLANGKLNASLKPSIKVSDLTAAGLEAEQKLQPDALVAPFRFIADAGDEYWLGMHNFYVITRYNRSRLYALAVYQLSQAIAEQMQAS